MKDAIERYKNVIAAVLITVTFITTIYAGACVLIDYRASTIAGKKDEPLYQELQFLNCMFRVTLTPEQQKEAEQLYHSVTRIGEK